MTRTPLPLAIRPVLKAGAIFFLLSFLFKSFQQGGSAGGSLSVPTAHAALKLSVLVLAVLVGIRSGISLAEIGFFSRKNVRWRALGVAAVLAGAITSIVMLLGQFPRNPLIAQFGVVGFFLQIVLLSSVAEEVLCRGLLQTELERAFAGRERRFGLSYPVWFSGLFFGGLHFSLLGVAAPATVAMTVAFTVVLGILCALARERTGGMVAPIVVHMLGNVGGIVGGIVMAIGARIFQGAAL
ncbi:MAG: CPBP family intramembrane metalloprotease [Betaproteobacteria bacterium]|nr:CPBP family intramembrane metalloprotease [Betaproteobacteria bacterium]